MSVLEVKNLKVIYQTKKRRAVALNNFSAVFENGMNVIVGYSGCGKTTLLRTILGLTDYDGDVILDGECIDDVLPKNRNFSYVSQQYILYPHYTVFDNIAFPLKLLKASRQEIEERVRSVAEMLDLSVCLNRKPKYISGGQQQRVAIARAIVKRPFMCFMDEPFSNTDEATRSQNVRWLKSVFESCGISCLYVTHDFREALELADKVFVMNDGKLETMGTPDEIFESDNEIVKSLKEGSHL